MSHNTRVCTREKLTSLSINASEPAVVHPPEVPLQILAGPGSGKTRTLTCRIAHLILHHNIPPAQIVAVTFTNKAADEMRHRLHALLGDRVNALNLGRSGHFFCVEGVQN
jgi:superfamily I DNA/RNA helicase